MSDYDDMICHTQSPLNSSFNPTVMHFLDVRSVKNYGVILFLPIINLALLISLIRVSLSMFSDNVSLLFDSINVKWTDLNVFSKYVLICISYVLDES